MQRRNVIAGLAALPLAPRRSSAQQSQGKIPRVGIVTTEESERAPKFDAFRAGLRDLGYISKAATSSSNSASPKAIFRGGRN
jgi:hypothetical protein